MDSDLIILKLNYSGSFDEILEENLLASFTLFDILIFYITNLKRLYIWVGKKATRSLKSHIPELRELVLKNYPKFNVIRNITVESGTEPQDFLDIINISEKELTNHIRNLERKILPSLSEINRMKEKAEKYLISENFEDSIKAAERIIELSKEIKVKSLEVDQNNFISEVKLQRNAKDVVDKIISESLNIEKQFDDFIQDEQYIKAHDLVNGFLGKYKNDYNISSIPDVERLLKKGKDLEQSVREQREQSINSMEELTEKFYTNFQHKKYLSAHKILNTGNELITNGFDKVVVDKWNSMNIEFFKVLKEKKSEIESLSRDAETFLDKNYASGAAEIYDNIIELIENFCK